MRFLKKWFLSCITILILLSVSRTPLTVSAATKPVSITTCKLTSTNMVQVTATAGNTQKIYGDKFYLFALTFSESGITQKSMPLSSVNKAKKTTFYVKLNNAKESTLLYSKFVIASKKQNGTYKAISNTKYISNPRKIAKYTYAFPKATSKKGLQVSPNMLEDAIDLNVRHSALNIVFSELLPTAAERNNTFSVSYKYHGKTYWFRKALVYGYDAQLTALKENNVVVSAILLLGWRDDLKSLIYPSGRTPGHAFYAWNTSNAAAREQLQATLSFLGSRYGTSSAEHGRIVNWIVGNEVNNYSVYNYAGQKTLAQYAKIYADAFRMTYNTMTSIYANARVYISLDHLWNTHISGCFTSREMLERFVYALKKRGNINWNLAFHPYGSPLTEPKFWSNVNGQAIQSLSSPVISMKNINVLTSYIRENYGSKTRIILSEQGYTSVRHFATSASGNKTDPNHSVSKTDAQKEQSAAIAYSYYLTEADDMIDSFIMNRHVDNQIEIDQGLDLGLWTTDSSSGLPEWADTKKDSWQVFKYMDSNKAASVTSNALSVIGINNWTDVIPNYNKKLYRKTVYASSALRQVNGYEKSAVIPANWNPYGAVTTGSRGTDTFSAYHDNRRNRNSLWGFSQTLSPKADFSSAPCFYTTLNVHGASAAEVQITIRFFSGKKILECSRTIPCNMSVKLGVSLEKWKGKNSVQKIQVLVSPVRGKWADNAYIIMTTPVCGN